MQTRLFLSLILLASQLWAADGPMSPDRLGPEVKQLIVSIAPSWNSSKGTLRLFDKTDDGWHSSAEIPVLYGKNGLVWGRGVLGTTEPGTHKMERDKRAPAGVFAIGKIYTYDAKLPRGSSPLKTAAGQCRRG